MTETMSATTAEAVSIPPAPGPSSVISRIASPWSMTALKAPSTPASGGGLGPAGAGALGRDPGDRVAWEHDGVEGASAPRRRVVAVDERGVDPDTHPPVDGGGCPDEPHRHAHLAGRRDVLGLDAL